MQDLCSNIYYKIKFNVELKETNSDLIWIVINHIKESLLLKYQGNITKDQTTWMRLKNGNKIIENGLRVTSVHNLLDLSVYDHEKKENGSDKIANPDKINFWACKIIENKVGDSGTAPQIWTTEIGLNIKEPDRNVAILTCLVYYQNQPSYFALSQQVPDPNMPEIILSILNDDRVFCFAGIDRPTSKPRKLCPGECVELWERINCPDRAVPYVFISSQKNPEGGQINLIDPEKLAQVLGGNAVVYYSNDENVIEEMNYVFKKEFHCFGGAIRVYNPAVNVNDPKDYVKHRYFDSDFINEYGEDQLLYLLYHNIVTNSIFKGYIREDDLRKEKYIHDILTNYKIVIDEWKDALKDWLLLLVDYAKEMDEFKKIKSELEQKIEDANLMLDYANENIEELRKDNENLIECAKEYEAKNKEELELALEIATEEERKRKDLEAEKSKLIDENSLSERGNNITLFFDSAFSFVSRLFRKEKTNELDNNKSDDVSMTSPVSLPQETGLLDKSIEYNKIIHELESRIDKLENRINYYYKPIANQNIGLKKSIENRFSSDKLPKSAADIVDYFKNTFPDRIDFTEDVVKNIDECIIPPEKLWNTLFCLVKNMYELRFYGSGGDVFAAFEHDTGIEAKRGEGKMTRKDKDLMKQFKTVYDNTEIDIEPHITFKTIEQSIHFGFSDKHKKIIIGSCGKHKKIYSSLDFH